MAFDFDRSFDDVASDSFNKTNTTNTVNVAAAVTDSGNSYDDNVDLNALGSFDDSHATDDSTNDSYNTSSTDLTKGSYNSVSFTNTDDHSVNIGDRSYNTGFGDIGGVAAAGAGDLDIDSRSTVVDQSINADVDSGGFFPGGGGGIVPAVVGGGGFLPGGIDSHASAVVASGDGSMAAGDDIRIDEHLDASTNIFAGGDVNVDNESTSTDVWHSYNTVTDASTTTDDSTNVNIDDSFNHASWSESADGSFNDEVHNVDTSHWDVDANVIWGSSGAAIVDDAGM